MQPQSQLLQQGFDRTCQGSFWPDEDRDPEFVIKLHHASRLHFDFRIELYGKLLSFALDASYRWDLYQKVRIARVGDHQSQYMFSERCIPKGQYGAGPMLVWDCGTFCFAGIQGSSDWQNALYEELLKGHAVIELNGIRVRGLFRLTGSGKDWSLERLTPSPFPIEDDQCSVLSGRSLQEIAGASEPALTIQKSTMLWLEWKNYYADNRLDHPQVITLNHQVIDMNMAAERRGITVGMRKHQFLGIDRSCSVKDWAADPEKAKRWLDLCVPYSGIIEPIEERVAAMDLSAHPSPRDLTQQLCRTLEKGKFGVLQTGLAPSKWMAQSFSIQGLPLDSSRSPKEVLAELSIDCLLTIDPQERERLIFLGYRTIGEVSQIPYQTLRMHFGANALAISQAARGFCFDTVQPLYPKGCLIEHFYFESPVESLQTIEATLRQLATRLAYRLSGQQASSVAIWMEEEDRSVQTIDRKLKRPIHGAHGVWAALRTVLEQTPPEVSLVRLSAKLDDLEPIQSRQNTLFLKDRQVSPDANVKTLRAAFGEGAVVRAGDLEVPRRKLVLREWKHATGWE